MESELERVLLFSLYSPILAQNNISVTETLLVLIWTFLPYNQKSCNTRASGAEVRSLWLELSQPDSYGKVHIFHDCGDKLLLMVASDRISAFDFIPP